MFRFDKCLAGCTRDVCPLLLAEYNQNWNVSTSGTTSHFMKTRELVLELSEADTGQTIEEANRHIFGTFRLRTLREQIIPWSRVSLEELI
jgi:hypothetical protein